MQADSLCIQNILLVLGGAVCAHNVSKRGRRKRELILVSEL